MNTASIAPVVLPRRTWQVLAVSAAGVFVVFLDATVVNIAFPAITAEFPDVTLGTQVGGQFRVQDQHQPVV